MRFTALPETSMSDIHESSFSDGTWAVISITHRDGQWPEITETEQCKGILRMLFADIDRAWEGDNWSDGSSPVLFNKTHADDILDFAERMREANVDCVIVHCKAGISRSPAVAAALTEIYGGDSKHFFARHQPNMHVYRMLLNTYHEANET
jgi:predicted protein tyrosine phosphatase